jgi:hypothetical protein
VPTQTGELGSITHWESDDDSEACAELIVDAKGILKCFDVSDRVGAEPLKCGRERAIVMLSKTCSYAFLEPRRSSNPHECSEEIIPFDICLPKP